MSYHSLALGDEYADQMSCLNRANSSSQVAGIDALVTNLTKTWNPTGFYRPADVQTLIDTLDAEARAVGVALAAAPLSTGDAQASKDQAFEDILRQWKDRSVGYVKAVADARASGATVIDAPGLKDWVIKSMRAISDGYVTATVLQCRQSWAEKWLDRGYQAMVKIGSVAARIVGVVVKIGENIVKAVDSAAGILGVIIRYAPLAAAGYGAYWLFSYLKKKTPR